MWHDARLPAECLSNRDQVFAALWFKARGAFSNNLDQEDSDVAFCNDMLGKVSQCCGSATERHQHTDCRRGYKLCSHTCCDCCSALLPVVARSETKSPAPVLCSTWLAG